MKKHQRWFIAGMLLCVLLLAACSTQTDTADETDKTDIVEKTEKNETNEEIETSKVPADFTKGYMKADFEAMNSPAKENGLGDTPVYMNCVLTELFELDANYYGYIIDDDDNKWLLMLNTSILASIDEYSQVAEKNIVLCGYYQGFSEKYKLPAIALSKLCVVSTGSIKTGAAYYMETTKEQTVESTTGKIANETLTDADIISYINGTAKDMNITFESVSIDDSIVYIKIVLPSGTAKNMILQDTNTLTLWKTLCDAYNDYAISLIDVLKNLGRDDLHICIMLLNDENKENALYTSLDGIEVYNAAD